VSTSAFILPLEGIVFVLLCVLFRLVEKDLEEEIDALVVFDKGLEEVGEFRHVFEVNNPLGPDFSELLSLPLFDIGNGQFEKSVNTLMALEGIEDGHVGGGRAGSAGLALNSLILDLEVLGEIEFEINNVVEFQVLLDKVLDSRKERVWLEWFVSGLQGERKALLEEQAAEVLD